MIENHWFSDKFRHSLRLHFHTLPEMLGTMREAMIALSPDGDILGANRSALELIGLNVPALRKLGLDAVFGTSVGAIADHCRHRGDVAMQLRPHHRGLPGAPLYARAQLNWPTFWPSVSLATGVSLPIVAAEPPAPARASAPQSVADTGPSPATETLRVGSTLQAQELVAIRSAVDAAGGNISRAARQLGVARNTIYRKLGAADSAA